MKHRKLRQLVLLALVLAATWSLEAAAAEGVVNINTATEEQLQLLPRVGETVAKRIAEFRKTNGQFEAKEELLLVEGIGEKTFALMQPHVVIEGETTLTEKVRVARAKDS